MIDVGHSLIYTVAMKICEWCEKRFENSAASKYCNFDCYTEARKNNIRYTVDENGCHICTSHAGDKDGYPKKCERLRNGVFKTYRISRYLWAKKNGEIPKGMLLLHNCDNPTCINLNHLRVGTVQDNSDDAVARGRMRRGTEVFLSKLTEKDVIQIKKLLESKKDAELADRYNVSPSAIWNIRNNKTWRHIGGEL